MEEMAELKYQRSAEVKATYDMLMKKLNPEKHAEKIEKMKEKKEAALKSAQNEIDKTKKDKINEIKDTFKGKRLELNSAKDKALQELQSQESSRRKTMMRSRAMTISVNPTFMSDSMQQSHMGVADNRNGNKNASKLPAAQQLGLSSTDQSTTLDKSAANL